MRGGPENIYGCGDTLISKRSPSVYISNFSRRPINIPAGSVLSQGHNPSTWLDKEGLFSKSKHNAINAQANLLCSIVNLEETSLRNNPFMQTAKSEVKYLHDMS